MTYPFDPQQMLGELNAAGVRYVVVGGVAAVIQGSNIATGDADICPEDSPENVEVLAQEAADRPKDRLTLPTLRKLRELRRRRPDLP